MAKQVVVTLDDYNYDAYHCMEHPSGESKTVPGEAMTVREIFDRYARGQDIDDEHVRDGKFYDEEQDYDSPDLEKLALGGTIENQEYLQELKLDIEIKRKKLNDFLKKLQEAKTVPDVDPVSTEGNEGDDSGNDEPLKTVSRLGPPPKRKKEPKRSDGDEGSDG